MSRNPCTDHDFREMRSEIDAAKDRKIETLDRFLPEAGLPQVATTPNPPSPCGEAVAGGEPTTELAERMQEELALFAKTHMHPATHGGVLMMRAMKPNASLADHVEEAVALRDALEDFGGRVAKGATSELATMAATQAASLNVLYTSLAGRALENTHSPHFESFMKLALKAQAQCISALQAVTALRRPAVVARQLNVAQQQVVNNGTVMPAGAPPAASPGAPGAVENPAPIVRSAGSPDCAPEDDELDP